MRTIGVVTVARSDFGIYLPLLRAIRADPDLRLRLLVSGGHLCPEFGCTVNEITAQGFTISETIDMLLSADTPAAIAKSMGLGILGFSQSYARQRPDILVVLGDRFETHAAALAAVPFNIPLAHIHGGEVTQGAIDDALRHAITKYSHLHFVATPEYGARVVQLGEEPHRVIVSGAPSLDNLHCLELLSAEQLANRFQLQLDRPPLLVTYHPVTLPHGRAEWRVNQLLAALEAQSLPIVITKPGADTDSRLVMRRMEEFARGNPRVQLVDNLGTQGYFSLMKQAAAMVGNSSSGIIEAASFELPVVNIGFRQQGRARSANVLDVGETEQEILDGIRQALSPDFRQTLSGMSNCYGSGHATRVILEHLKRTALDSRLLTKAFYDLPASQYAPATVTLGGTLG